MSDDIIVMQALRKEYFEVVAVDDVDLAIAAGEIHGLIGPNGAGKTTLLRMLATTLEPTSGRIFYDGADIWRKPARGRFTSGLPSGRGPCSRDGLVKANLASRGRGNALPDLVPALESSSSGSTIVVGRC